MNKAKKRTIPSEAPISFIPNRWTKHVFQPDGSISRQYYELAALTELKNCIRSGDISVVGSRQYKHFDDYLFSRNEWESARDAGTRLAVSTSFDEYIQERMQSLNERLQYVSKSVEGLDGITIESGEIHKGYS